MTECLFCGKSNGWRSNIHIVLKADPKSVLAKLSVCPKCRKLHTVSELYEKTAEKAIETFREVVEEGEE